MQTGTSYSPEVIADASGKWVGNGLRFATFEEADQWVTGLSLRWFAVRDTRVVVSAEAPNSRLVNARAEPIAEPTRVTSPDGSVDHAELCKCGDARWKHKHDAACQNLACSCNRFRAKAAR